eukprot:TRINITY_DN51927_c0_g1_i1.p1 TRINITY_DN51927_c0_g1~~TRINITY_DN51927_c0_g1_i1.p1  ORF type:complete len:377 (-),score=60.93 TRINITY_DN51927_c0_g1_i1:57-1055(-)
MLSPSEAQRQAIAEEATFAAPGFTNRYYQASGYQGSRVLEHNQTGRFAEYVEVLWPSHAAIDPSGRIWLVNRQSHQVLLMKTSSRYIPWPAFYTDYAGSRGIPGYVDGSRLKARFNAPSGMVLVMNPKRPFKLYVADSNNHCIRVLDYASGRVATVAGSAGQPGLRDGPGQEARFNQPSSVGMDFEGLHLFALDNHRRVRYIKVYLKSREVITLVGGACRAVKRWMVYSSIVLRTVGCHPDWSARMSGEKDVDMFISGEGVFYCAGHQATCAPRHHPALADRLSPQLLTQEFAETLLAEIPPEDPFAMPLVLESDAEQADKSAQSADSGSRL